MQNIEILDYLSTYKIYHILRKFPPYLYLTNLYITPVLSKEFPRPIQCNVLQIKYHNTISNLQSLNIMNSMSISKILISLKKIMSEI